MVGWHNRAGLRLFDRRFEGSKINFTKHTVGGFNILAIFTSKRFAIGHKMLRGGNHMIRTETIRPRSLQSVDESDTVATDEIWVFTVRFLNTAPTEMCIRDSSGSVELKGEASSELLLGAIPFPEKQFTVSAWINTSNLDGNGCIIAAQIPYILPYGGAYPYPYVRGLSVNLVRCV